MIPLRGYQVAALDALHAFYAGGGRRALLAHATGLGKTIVFSHWLREGDGRALVLAHRDELITQAVQKLTMVAPELASEVGVVKAERNEVDKRIVVASVQTVSSMPRLRQLGRDFARVVVDEAHHSAADTYQRVLAYVGAWTEGGPLVLGVTATPSRADKKALGDTWERVVHAMSILDGIRGGFLCDLRGLAVQTAADFSGLRVRHGDFIDTEAEAALLKGQGPEAIVAAIQGHAKGRSTLVFTPGVESAHRIAACCRAQGLSGVAVDGETGIDSRRVTLRDFHAGAIDVVANCGVLTEGYDEPRVSCIVMARPTKSEGLYTQMVGRGTRTFPGKADCLILDVCGVTHRHDLVSLPALFGGEISDGAQTRMTEGKSVCEAMAVQEGRQLTFEPVDLFAQRPFAWVKTQLGYVLGLGSKEAGMILLREDASGWAAWHDAASARLLWSGPSLSYAQGVAEDFVRTQGVAKLAKRSATWRTADMTPGQRRMLEVWRVPYGEDWTRGVASDAITRAIADAKARVRAR